MFEFGLTKLLKPSRSLVISLIPLGQLKRLLAGGLMNFRILFLKILRLQEFLMFLLFKI